MTHELKACPFCGGKASFDEDRAREWAADQTAKGNGYVMTIECRNCGAEMRAYDHQIDEPTADKVIEHLFGMWNRRATDFSEENEKLKGDLETAETDARNTTRNLIRELEKNNILRQTIVMTAIEHAVPNLLADYRGEGRK